MPEVRVAPGLSTTLFFDARIHPDEVKLEGRERFQRLGIAEDHLALIPSAAFRQGERVRLEVRFRDGGTPERVVVMLVVDAAQVDRQVEFFRHQRSAESYRQEVEELKLGIAQLQREVDRLRGSRVPAGAIESLFAAAEGSDGVSSVPVSYQRVSSPSRLGVSNVRVMRLGSRLTAIRLKVAMKDPGADWTAAGASLVDAQGRAVKVGAPWQQEPLRPTSTAVVVMMLEDLSALRRGRYTLKLWDEGGRSVAIEGLEVR